MRRFFSVLIFISILISGCAAEVQPPTPRPVTPTPTQTPIRVLPTPAAAGEAITWKDLQARMDQSEITDSFITEFGSQRISSPGQKFIWVHVEIINTGTQEVNLPAAEHFSVLYAQSEYKPTYGHRRGYADYTALGPRIFPGQTVEAWLRFDIPVTAELKDLWFVFLPESAQVGVLPSSPDYPWGGEHPTFAWFCAP